MMKLDKGTIVCLAGDFNFPDIIWDTLSLKKGAKYPNVSRRFIEIIQDHSLEQLVTEPTRGRNILDLFLTTHPTLVNKVTMTPGISDHDGIPMTDLSTKPKTNRPPPRKIYQFHKADNESIKQDLRNLSDTMTSRNNSEATSTCLWKEFKDGVLKAMDDHKPTKIIKKRDQTPWINSTVRSGLRRKQRAYNWARDSNKDSDWEKFRSVRKEVQKDTKRAYWSYVRNTCLESPKQFWGFIKRLKNDTCGIQSLRENGKLSSDKYHQG